nr:hypothetical protein [Cupriavidus sp. KK10]
MRLTERPAWRALAALAVQPLPHLRELVLEPGPGDYARLSAAGIELDFTRQRINGTVHEALLALAQDASRRSATPCSPGSPSTPPKAAPCCTSRCAAAPTRIHPRAASWRRKSMRN